VLQVEKERRGRARGERALADAGRAVEHDARGTGDGAARDIEA
jgi:hypothetical protein